MANLLDQLRSMTTVVADTGDINSIEAYRPQDATTNPSLILKAAQMEAYQPMIDDALSWAQGRDGDGDVVRLAVDRLAVLFGQKILDIIPGRVSTEVDARLSHDTEGTIERARQIIALYQQEGIGRDRVLIKIASTWEGIRAADTLEDEGIHCNMTLMFGLHQAVAAAEAGVTLISPFVGRILDWYKARTGREEYPAEEDPGVRSVTEIYNYYKKFDHPTEIMGASFRNLGEIIELAGCDLLTIAPSLLDELQSTEGTLTRKLSPDQARTSDIQRLEIDEDRFRALHAQDEMAHEKLDEGIGRFSDDIVALEKLVRQRL